MSITTLGLNTAGTSPISSSAPYFPSTAAGSAGGRDGRDGRDRRSSVSTNSQDSQIDESAIEDDDTVATHAQSVPTTPFARRMSIGTGVMFGRGGASPGTTSSHNPSVSTSVSGGSTLYPIPARQEAHHESAPLNSSAFSVPKQRTGSLSKPSIGPSGLSQGLQQARRTSLSSLAQSQSGSGGDVAGRTKATVGAATPQGRRTSVSSFQTITPAVNFTGGPASVGNISSSLGRSASGRKPRTLSDHPGSSGVAGLDWSEQFRSRAESTATRPHRPSFGASYTAGGGGGGIGGNNYTSPNAESRPVAIGGGQGQGGGVVGHHRAASVSDMSEPPKGPKEMPMPKVEGKKGAGSWLGGGGRKPDEVGERILRGEFLMD